MSQLLKHYLINRDTGAYATTPARGYVMPNIEGLEIVHHLSDENDIEFCLSTCPNDTSIIEVEGLQILTQEEWDAEIISYDVRQEQKRFNILRPIRDEILFVTDWIVIKAKEQGTNLSAEFKNWRQSLRDLPTQTPFPSGFPTLPTIIETDEKVLSLYVRWNEIVSVPMINDPLTVV